MMKCFGYLYDRENITEMKHKRNGLINDDFIYYELNCIN